MPPPMGVTGIQINDTSSEMMITKGGVIISKEDPKASLAARTRERLAKFGIISLRMHDVYLLKRVWIDENDIKQSPYLSRSRELISE